MVYWNLEKAGDLAQFDEFRRKKNAIEEAYLQLRRQRRDLEAALRADPDNAEIKAKLEDNKRQLQELEKKAPWLASEVPVEMALWGTTHGLL